MLRLPFNPIRLTLWIAACHLMLAGPGYSQTPTGRQGFCVHGGGVNLPIEKFLLIRKGNQLGALRLTRITPDTATKPRAGEWLGTVAYESYFADQPRSLIDPSANKVSDELRFGQIKGFGFHYSWQSGNLRASVGPWKFAFFDEDGMFMTAVDFWNGINHDSGLEFAPTGFTNIANVDPNDSRLHWFHFDPNTDIPCPIAVPSTATPRP